MISDSASALAHLHTQILQFVPFISWRREDLSPTLLFDPAPSTLLFLKSALPGNVVLTEFEESVADDRGEGEDQEEDAARAGEGWLWAVVWNVGHAQ